MTHAMHQRTIPGLLLSVLLAVLFAYPAAVAQESGRVVVDSAGDFSSGEARGVSVSILTTADLPPAVTDRVRCDAHYRAPPGAA